MIEQKIPEKQKKIKNKLAAAALVIILIFSLISLIRNYQNNLRINQEIVTLEQEANKIERDNLELTELIKYLNSTAHIEEKARIDLGLKKEGETAVVIPDLQNNFPTLNPGHDNPENNIDSNFNPKKWWNYFFNADNKK